MRIPLLLLLLWPLQGAFALLPPWQIFAARVKVSLGADACVRVGNLEASTQERSDYLLPIAVCDQSKAEALALIAGGSRNIGGASVEIDFTGPQGLATPQSISGLSYGELDSLIRTALSGNPLFVSTLITQKPAGLWILIRKTVVQYYADNIANLYLQNDETAEHAFQQALNLNGALPPQVHTSTVTRRPKPPGT